MSKPLKIKNNIDETPLAQSGKNEQPASEQREKGHRRLELRNQLRRQQEINEINSIIENAWPPLT